MANEVFKPTEKMIRLMQAMLDIEVKPTITAACEAASIDRSTYYEWFDNPEFVGWFNRVWNEAMSRQVPWMDKIGIMRGVKDFRYWEAMQIKYGKYMKKDPIADGTINVVIKLPTPNTDNGNENGSGDGTATATTARGVIDSI